MWTLLSMLDSLLMRLNIQFEHLKDAILHTVDLIFNLPMVYLNSPPNLKNKLLSSILSDKLIWKESEYRNPKFKGGIKLIFSCTKALGSNETKTGDKNENVSRLVPGAGLEPARPFGSTDFKSVVSTNSTIRADGSKQDKSSKRRNPPHQRATIPAEAPS